MVSSAKVPSQQVLNGILIVLLVQEDPVLAVRGTWNSSCLAGFDYILNVTGFLSVCPVTCPL